MRALAVRKWPGVGFVAMSGVRNLEDDAYDSAVYLQRARERKRREEEELTSRATSRSLLQARDKSLNLDKDSGTRSFVSVEIVGDREVKRGAGFFCEMCACTLRDSQAYMAHLNSRSHLANAGFAMKVARSSVSQVKQRFAKHAKKQSAASIIMSKRAKDERLGADKRTRSETNTAKRGSSAGREVPPSKRARIDRSGEATDVDCRETPGEDQGSVVAKEESYSVDAKVGVVEAQLSDSEEDAGDDEFMKMMGFSGFGTTKKQ